MDVIMRTYLVELFAMSLLSGCTETNTAGHVSRQQAESFLRKEGLLAQTERIVSAEWHEDSSNWLFLVEYPGKNGKTEPGYWFVNAGATEYSGGTCKH